MTSTTKSYRLISADSHVNEPRDLWTARASSKYVDRAPRMESFAEGDAWIVEGVDGPINFGMNACAGLPSEKQTPWIRFDDMRSGGWDPAERCNEMDRDGVDAEVLYPTPRLMWGVLGNPDRDFALEMVRIYNDWLSEYCSHAPDRLLGTAVLPYTGVKDAIDEFERAIQLPGIRSSVMSCYPHGTTTLDPDDDALFAVVAESGTPLSIHVSLFEGMPYTTHPKLPGDVRWQDAPKRMLELLWTGVFERFPDLHVVFAEVDCGWVPYFLEQVDNRYHRLSPATRPIPLSRPPSEFFREQVSYTFITDAYAINNRHAVGVQNMLWSSDYPHLGADWPYSARTIQAAMAGVPAQEQSAILAGNAVRLYGLG